MTARGGRPVDPPNRGDGGGGGVPDAWRSRILALLAGIVFGAYLILLYKTGQHGCIFDTYHPLCKLTGSSNKRKHLFKIHVELGPPTQPNIIVFLADDLGWNDVGFHASMIHTPNLDRLARAGVILDQFYTSPICTPSRSELLSGRYSSHTGLQHMHIDIGMTHALPADVTTLPQKLREAGYGTYMVGKWHLGGARYSYLPHNRGFDKHCGIYSGDSGHFSHEKHSEKGDAYSLFENGEAQWQYKGEYMTHVYNDKMHEYLGEHLETQWYKPFFLYMAFEATHAPLEAPAEYKDKYVNITKDNKRSTYAGMATAMDEAIGNITSFLKQKDVLDNTVIFFASDNGGFTYQGANNYPLRDGKGTYYDGGIRVPCFVSGAKIQKPEREVKEIFHMTDLYSTIVSLAGGKITDADKVDGFDIWPTLSEGKPSPRKEFLIGIDPFQPLYGKSMYPDVFNTGVRGGLRMGDYKLLTGWPGFPNWQPRSAGAGTKNVALYNVAKDPSERHNLAEKEPQKVNEMLQRLAEIQKNVTRPTNHWDRNWHFVNGTMLPWLPH